MNNFLTGTENKNKIVYYISCECEEWRTDFLSCTLRTVQKFGDIEGE